MGQSVCRALTADYSTATRNIQGARSRSEIRWPDKCIGGAYGAALGPDAEAGHGFGDALVVEAHPVALAELGPGP